MIERDLQFAAAGKPRLVNSFNTPRVQQRLIDPAVADAVANRADPRSFSSVIADNLQLHAQAKQESLRAVSLLHEHEPVYLNFIFRPFFYMTVLSI